MQPAMAKNSRPLIVAALGCRLWWLKIGSYKVSEKKGVDGLDDFVLWLNYIPRATTGEEESGFQGNDPLRDRF